jgi:cell division protein FtsB
LKTFSNTSESPKPPASERVWVKFLRNKYLISGIAFGVWMLFLDRNDIPTQWKRIQELNTLQQSEKSMNKQISDTKQELDLLKTNPSTLEKYAREKYMMKKDNEDLYIITSTKQ